MATTLIDSVLHWRKKLEKSTDDEYILNVIRKLSKVPISLEILETTHIGMTIRKLSKRGDGVGEKAKTLLNKWREFFTSQTSDKNQRLPTVSKKVNVNKKSKTLNKHTSHDKTNPKQESRHESKQKKSVSHNSQSSKEHINGSCHVDSSPESSHSPYKYEVKERNFNYMDYDPHVEGSEGYNPECPELFPSDKPVKNKKQIVAETYEPSSYKPSYKLKDLKVENEDKFLHKKLKTSSHSLSNSEDEIYEPSSLKHQIKIENEDKYLHKKSKSSSHSPSNLDSAAESKKSLVKSVKSTTLIEKSKDNSHSSTLKKESNKIKSHSESTKRHETASDAIKTKRKEHAESDNVKSKKPKVKIISSEEFTSSEVSFEDCLGFNDIVALKKSSKSHSSKKQSSSNSSCKKEKPPENKKVEQKNISVEQKNISVEQKNISVEQKNVSVEQKVKEKPKDSSHKSKKKVPKDSSHLKREEPFRVPKPTSQVIMPDIPEISINYFPLPRSPEFYAPKKKEALTNEEAIAFTTSRREKTAVYSGRKTSHYYTAVPSLQDICLDVLKEHIDAIECVGDCSYDMFKPVLVKCTPDQLLNIEDYNPDFLDYSDELWQVHCSRDFKLLKPGEHESWRELYLRARDEREKKLKSVTENISKSIAKSVPVRQVKLAYVEGHSYVKPPRDVARKQALYGTAAPVSQVVKSSMPLKRSSPKGSSSTVTVASNAPTINSAPVPPPKKPKVAPLMAKTLKAMKAFRRK